MTSTHKLTCFLSLVSLAVLASADFPCNNTSNFTSNFPSTYASNAENAFQVLQQWYSPTSGLYSTCGWWNAASCITSIAGLAAIDSSVVQTAASVFAATYANAPSGAPVKGGPCNGFCTMAYDDNGWWALAWIAAYDITTEAKYLSLAEAIFDDLTGAGPTNCNNGGVYWSLASRYVNAVTNELFFSVAAHLANRPTAKGSSYYETIAISQLNWFDASGMINKENLINDGLNPKCTNNNAPVWTYNQGAILGGLVELSTATRNAAYITTAHTLAAATLAHLLDQHGILHEDSCEPTNCDGDQTQFKGIFVRNLLKLHLAAPQESYVIFFNENADSILANDRQAVTGWFGVDWAGPVVETPNASTQSSALDALIAAAAAAVA